jgi:heat shock protein HtpX
VFHSIGVHLHAVHGGKTYRGGQAPAAKAHPQRRPDKDFAEHELERLRRRLVRNLHSSHSHRVMTGMMGLLVLCGYLSGKSSASHVHAGARGLPTLASAHCPPRVVLRSFGARPLTPGEAPDLYALLLNICARAGMRRAPELFWLPVAAMNAYALGGPDNACITVTEGLLRGLSRAEVAGILAHEVAHILNHDTHALNWAAAVQSQIAASALRGMADLASSGACGHHGPHTALLASAPALAHLLYLALSRVREFDADATAIDLIDDPAALSAALWKLEHSHSGRTPLNAHFQDDAATRSLRSHPGTWERIASLAGV